MIPTYTSRPSGNGVFLIIAEAIQSKITFKSGVELFIATNNQEEYATCVAEVYSLGPRNELGVYPGETVAISYLVTSACDVDDKGNRVYHRAHIMDGKLVWAAENEQVLGVKRDGKWQAVGDWVFMTPVTDQTKSSFIITLPTIRKGCGKLVSGSDAPPGSIVFFEKKFRSIYAMPDGQEYIILHKDRILAYNYEQAAQEIPV